MVFYLYWILVKDFGYLSFDSCEDDSNIKFIGYELCVKFRI